MENDKKKSSTLLKSQEKRQHPSQRLKWDSHSMETALPKGLEIIVADWFKLSSVFSVLQTLSVVRWQRYYKPPSEDLMENPTHTGYQHRSIERWNKIDQRQFVVFVTNF